MDMQKNLLALIQLRLAARRRYASASHGQAAKLAYAYAKQALSGEGLYDMMGRLIVLEGAAGVKEMSWARNPVRGMSKAKLHFAEQIDNMHPEWFSGEDTGMLRMLTRTLDGFLSRSGVPDMSGEDLVQDGLAGLGATIEVDGKVTRRKIKNKFWESGNYLSDKILSGVESPTKVAAGTLGKALKKMALNTIKVHKRHQELMGVQVQENNELSRGGESESGYGVAEPASNKAVFDEMFYGNGPLGQRARTAIRKIINQKLPSSVRGIMLAWVDGLDRGEFLKGVALATAAGFEISNASKVRVFKAWKKSAPIIFKALGADTQLMKDFSLALSARGIELSPVSWADIMKNPGEFGKHAHQGASLHQDVSRLASQVPSLRQLLLPLLRG
jgi:hypothetical protein